jgi:hypothetical protein
MEAEAVSNPNPPLAIEAINLDGLVRINLGRNVNYYIRQGETYTFHFPDTKTIVKTYCSGKAIRAADMRMDVVTVNGVRDQDQETCTFGYVYEDLDNIHFDSFQYKQKCEVYCTMAQLIKFIN